MLSHCLGIYETSTQHETKDIWAASRQNQQNGTCVQQRLRSAWASTQSDQSLLSAWRKLGSLATHWVHSELWSDWADAHDLSLHWTHSHIVGFVMRWLICALFLTRCTKSILVFLIIMDELTYRKYQIPHSKRKNFIFCYLPQAKFGSWLLHRLSTPFCFQGKSHTK